MDPGLTTEEAARAVQSQSRAAWRTGLPRIARRCRWNTATHLEAKQVARAFEQERRNAHNALVVPAVTLAQRLVRAKRRIFDRLLPIP